MPRECPNFSSPKLKYNISNGLQTNCYPAPSPPLQPQATLGPGLQVSRCTPSPLILSRPSIFASNSSSTIRGASNRSLKSTRTQSTTRPSSLLSRRPPISNRCKKTSSRKWRTPGLSSASKSSNIKLASRPTPKKEKGATPPYPRLHQKIKQAHQKQQQSQSFYFSINRVFERNVAALDFVNDTLDLRLGHLKVV